MMQYHVFLIDPNGQVIYTTQGHAPTYNQCSKAVDGPAETVPHFTKLKWEDKEFTRGTAFANEEGWMRRLDYNTHATKYWRQSCPAGDRSMMNLCGTVIFYTRAEPRKVLHG